MPLETMCEITAVQQVADMTFKIVAESKEIAGDAKPGQFAMLGFDSPSLDPFLRRPMSFAKTEFGRLEFIVRVVGWGSALLATLKSGDHIPILGPLGNGFPEPSERAILVGGGTGIAPMAFAASRWKKAILLYGERDQENLCGLHNGICETKIITEDGSYGEKGLVTDYLQTELEKGPAEIFTCGPVRMMERVAQISKELGAKCYVSLEARMACGIGACVGCTVETRDGYKKVCSDGPVFSAEKIIWEALDD